MIEYFDGLLSLYATVYYFCVEDVFFGGNPFEYLVIITIYDQ